VLRLSTDKKVETIVFFSISRKRIIALSAPSARTTLFVLTRFGIVLLRSISFAAGLLGGLLTCLCALAALVFILDSRIIPGALSAESIVLAIFGVILLIGAYLLERFVTWQLVAHRMHIAAGEERSEFVVPEHYSSYIVHAVLGDEAGMNDEIRLRLFDIIDIVEADKRIHHLEKISQKTAFIRKELYVLRMSVIDEIEMECQRVGLVTKYISGKLEAERITCTHLTHSQAEDEMLRLASELNALRSLVNATEPQPSA